MSNLGSVVFNLVSLFLIYQWNLLIIKPKGYNVVRTFAMVFCEYFLLYFNFEGSVAQAFKFKNGHNSVQN